jgi:hypothetical protein
VTLQVGDTERKAFIEAAPQYKGLNFYDEHNKRVHQQTINPSEQTNTMKQDAKKERQQQKQSGENDDGAGAPAQKNKKQKKQGISG